MCYVKSIFVSMPPPVPGPPSPTCASREQRHMDDQRFERELKHKESLQKQADKGGSKEAEQVTWDNTRFQYL